MIKKQMKKIAERRKIQQNTSKITRIYQELFPQNQFSRIERLTQKLEKIDLLIDQPIKQGIAVYGLNRAGKTTLCQLLAGGTVKGILKQGFKKVELASSQFKNAKIGNTRNSETLIPNILTININSVQITIIDTPGYGDNGGPYKIISNAYSHYHLYSRVQNMKFIIVFEIRSIYGMAEEFISTITEFINFFKDYDQGKYEIWESACFVFTKTDPKHSQYQYIINQLRYFMQSINIYDPQQQRQVKQITNYMIINSKIFTVQTPNQGQIMETKNLLNNINQKITTWYSRPIINDGYTEQVDMKKIAFNVGKQITVAMVKSRLAKQQLKQLIQYYNIRITQFLRTDAVGISLSFDAIIKQVIIDSMNHYPNSHNFLNSMSAFTNYFYKKFDPTLENQRQKKAEALFKLQQQKKETKETKDIGKSFNSKNNINNYFLKLFRFLKKVQEIKLKTTESMNLTQIGKSPMKFLKQLQKQLYEIIRQLHTISYKKEILISHYQIWLGSSQNYLRKDNIFAVSNKYKNMTVSLYLYDFMDSKLVYKEDQYQFVQYYENLRRKFVLDFKIDQNTINKLHLNCQLVDFFALDENQTNEKQIQILLIYSNQLIFTYHQKTLNQQEQQILQKMTNRLIVARITTQRKINDLNLEDDDKNKNILTLRKVSKQLINLYNLRKMFDCALDICKSINFVSSACRIYQLQIKNTPKDIKLRIQYSRYLAEHARQNKAIQILQDAFQVAEQIEDIQKITEQLIEVRNQLKNLQSSSSDYFNKLNVKQFHQQLNLFKSFHHREENL